MAIEGRVAVVTGAAQGIGAAYARHLAELGAAVAVADIQAEAAAAVAKEIEAAGGRALAVGVDVSSEESVAAMADRVREELGPTQILVNNAALYHSMDATPLLRTGLDYWRRVFSVNVDGVLLCTQAFASDMIEAGWGRVVNQTSIAAYSRGIGHYSVSKLAVVGLTVNLALELGPHGITVNAIAPGVIHTDATHSVLNDEIVEQLAMQTPIRKQAMPSDLLGTLRFLVGDDAAWMTGQTLIVDGGMTIRL